MSKCRYSFENLGNDSFELYEYGCYLLAFRRESFRNDFEEFAKISNRSSNWIGTILRLFQKKFPAPFPISVRTNVDRLLVKYGEEFLVKYLEIRGFRVVKKLDVSVLEVIKELESRGYEVEGLLNDCYYNSEVRK